MSEGVSLENVRADFGSFRAVDDVNVTIGAGEFFSFLGPSGCGKTTLLRMVSGFVTPSAGQIRIAGRDMAGIGPNNRPTALIFQNLALFPLMSVWENIAFGLEVRGVDKRRRRSRAEELLNLIELPDAADKMVSQLSGGQKQRVAIARALAVEPQVLLLDEPLSALDLKLRQHMRTELRAIQKRTGVTFIYITHDQGEALAMSDRVGVMNKGRLLQVGTPEEIYNRPENGFVASFVGENNRIAGKVAGRQGDTVIFDTAFGQLRGQGGADMRSSGPILYVRPENIRLSDSAAAENAIPVMIESVAFEGNFINVHARHDSGQAFIAQLRNEVGLSVPPVGARLFLGFASDAARVLDGSPAQGEAA